VAGSAQLIVAQPLSLVTPMCGARRQAMVVACVVLASVVLASVVLASVGRRPDWASCAWTRSSSAGSPCRS